MNHKNLKITTIQCIFWKLFERGGGQGIQFIISIFLARMLSPSDYGITGIVSIFIAIAGVFVQSGFASSIIQNQEIDDVDCSSAFTLNILVASILYIILFFSSPYISIFFSMPILESVLKVQALTLFLGAFSSVQNALISRNLEFKKGFAINLIGIIISGVVGISFAYMNYGVWSLVFSSLVGNLSNIIIGFFYISWKPKFLLSWLRIKKMFSFSSNVLLSNMLNVFFNNIYSLCIGKIYTSESLGFYNRGQSLPSLIITNIEGSLSAILFPILSIYQKDINTIKKFIHRSISLECFLIFPMMMGLAAIADPLVTILFTEKWLPCVPYIQWSCIAFGFWPIHATNVNVLIAMGYSKYNLKIELIKKGLQIFILCLTIPFGVLYMVIGNAVFSFLCTFINAYYNKKILNYGSLEQWKNIFPYYAVSTLMGIIVYSFKLFNFSTWALLIIQVFVGTLFYILSSHLLKLDGYLYIKKNIKSFLMKKDENI